MEAPFLHVIEYDSKVIHISLYRLTTFQTSTRTLLYKPRQYIILKPKHLMFSLEENMSS